MNDFQRSPHLIIVAMVAGLTLVLIACKADQNAQRLANYRERDLITQAAVEWGREVDRRMGMAMMAHVTIGEFEERFGGLTELTGTTDPKYADKTHSFYHEGSQRLFYLRFQDDRLMGYSSNHGNSDVDAGVVLETPVFRATESVRGTFLSGGLIAWVVCLIVGICWRRFRRHAVVLLPALSMVCGLCWFLAPNYSPTLRGVLSNDDLALFVFLLIGSLAFTAISERLHPQVV